MSADITQAVRSGLRVLVCGGRTFGVVTEFDDFGDPTPADDARAWREHMELVFALEQIKADKGISVVIHGYAQGADSLARIWVEGTNGEVLHAPFRADWRTHGKAAGPIRNQRMIDEGKPDLVVAFPGGKGTADMVRRAAAAGLPVVDYRLGKPS